MHKTAISFFYFLLLWYQVKGLETLLPSIIHSWDIFTSPLKSWIWEILLYTSAYIYIYCCPIYIKIFSHAWFHRLFYLILFSFCLDELTLSTVHHALEEFEGAWLMLGKCWFLLVVCILLGSWVKPWPLGLSRRGRGWGGWVEPWPLALHGRGRGRGSRHRRRLPAHYRKHQ